VHQRSLNNQTLSEIHSQGHLRRKRTESALLALDLIIQALAASSEQDAQNSMPEISDAFVFATSLFKSDHFVSRRHDILSFFHSCLTSQTNESRLSTVGEKLLDFMQAKGHHAANS